MAKHGPRAGGHRREAGLAASRPRAGCRVSGRLWVERDGETFLSWGRIVLLERIRDHGSISAAARSMKMGYRHAWELVESMNSSSPKPLVRTQTGGQRGGGAELTREGEAAIAGWWALVDRFSEWLAGEEPRLWRSVEGAAGL